MTDNTKLTLFFSFIVMLTAAFIGMQLIIDPSVSFCGSGLTGKYGEISSVRLTGIELTRVFYALPVGFILSTLLAVIFVGLSLSLKEGKDLKGKIKDILLCSLLLLTIVYLAFSLTHLLASQFPYPNSIC